VQEAVPSKKPKTDVDDDAETLIGETIIVKESSSDADAAVADPPFDTEKALNHNRFAELRGTRGV
jgi:hypothetical protein